MKKDFIKMHGLGNDFVIFDARASKIGFSPEKIRQLGSRNRGIGFDQMVVMHAPKTAGTDVHLNIYNADGSEVGACGNASRCIMALLDKDEAMLETKAGLIKGWRDGDKYGIDLGKVRLEWDEIPLSDSHKTISLPISEGVLKNPVGVNVGNPHAVFFVPDVFAVPLKDVGPKVENHEIFPERTNVEVVQILGRDMIRMRVWERGVGITEACGTGACAAVVAAARRELTGRKVKVLLDGGELDIEWRESDNHVLMTGEVAEVYRGTVDI